jgi:DNA-binding response OmpR family regulator
LLLLDDVYDQLQAFELGAADCVMKPFNIPKLVLQVRNLLCSIHDSITTEARASVGSSTARSEGSELRRPVHA